MAVTFIGGHKSNPTQEGPGVHVYRQDDGTVLKLAYTEPDVEGLKNEAEMLRILEGTSIAPRMGEEWADPEPVADDAQGCKPLYAITQEDLGESESVKDGEVFRQNAVRLLWQLRQNRIYHGDLTTPNIIVKNDWLYVVDFAQSLKFDDEDEGNRKMADSYHIYRYVEGTSSGVHGTPDHPRVVRRWLAVSGALGGVAPKRPLEGKALLDIGCFQGDFCAMAVADGMKATGVDAGGFRSGENSIQNAIELWDGMGITFWQQDIMDWTQFDYDAVLLFSTWPYILKDYGNDAAFDLLDRIVKSCGVLFFETQLAGDGPGPDFLVTDDDVANMLGQFGTPQPLQTFPVTGRPASRTVWQVKRG